MVQANKDCIDINYFGVYGRAEFIRMMCIHSGTNWSSNDNVFDQWPALKPQKAFGSLPEVTIEGVKINQSKAAARAVAIKLGYYSTDPKCQWQIDSILDFVQDDSILGAITGPA